MHVDLESSHFISVICKLGLFRVSCIPWTYYCFILFLVCWLQFLYFVFSLKKSVFSLTCPLMGLSTELCIWFTRFSISSVSDVLFIQHFCLCWISLSYLAVPSLLHPAVRILNQELIFCFEHTPDTSVFMIIPLSFCLWLPLSLSRCHHCNLSGFWDSHLVLLCVFMLLR